MRRRTRAIALLAVVAAAVVAVLLVVSREDEPDSRPLPAPVLGRSWAPNQTGYGQVRPREIFNGGDPTGLVRNVRWKDWGEPVATGSGEAEFVWPGTAVADNPLTPGARVVAFRLGTCRGRRAYTAVSWYFPKFDQSFDPETYINICTGDYVGGPPTTVTCPDVPLADGSGTATEVQAIEIPCPDASQIIANSNSSQHAESGGRFMEAGFRCGTQGAYSQLPATFACEHGKRQFLYTIGE